MARIAHIANLYGPKSGGLRTSMNALAQEYVELGHQVLLVVPGKVSKSSVVGGVKIIEVGAKKIPFTGGYRIILNLAPVKAALENFKPDQIEISDRTTLLSIADWARVRDIPTLFFAHERVDGLLNTFIPYLPGKRLLAQLWNRHTLHKVDRVVATTRYAAQEFVNLGVKISNSYSSKLIHVPLGVDLDRFNPDLKQGVGSSNQRYLLACTRLSKEKDPQFLIEIAKQLKQEGVNVSLQIAGSGPQLGKLKAQVDKHSLPITFLDFISDKGELAKLMAQADIFLAVGPIETFGLAALEALACGTPVICRAEAAISEIINDKCGKSAGREISIWVEHIKNYLTQELAATALAARARAEEFSWQQSAKTLRDFDLLARVS